MDKIIKSPEHVLYYTQFLALKEAGKLEKGSTYHVIDLPEAQDLIDGIYVVKYAEQDNKGNVIADTYRRKDDSYSCTELDTKLNAKVDKVNSTSTNDRLYGISSTGVQTVYTIGENTPDVNSIAKRNVLGQITAATPTDDAHVTTKKYVDNLINSETIAREAATTTLQNNITDISNKIDNTIVDDIAINYNGNDVTLSADYVNLNKSVKTNTTQVIKLASNDTAGLMSTADYKTLQTLTSRVSNLEGKTTRLLYNEKSDPTEDDINAFAIAAGYSSPFDGISVIVVETHHIWTYYVGTGWKDDGLNTVEQFTNTAQGIILGSVEDGKIYAESDGTGSVNGWSDLKNKVLANETNIQLTIETVSKNTANIKSLDTSKRTIISSANKIYSTDENGSQNELGYSKDASVDTIVQYTSTGNIVTNEPTEDSHVVTKKYVDDISKTKLDKVTNTADIGRVYAISTDGSQTTLNVDTTAKANTIVQRNTAGQIITATPTGDNHATTKKYVDEGKSAIKNSDGNIYKEISANSTPTKDTLALYSSTGTLKSNTPTANNDVVTKAYMDENAGKIDTISVNGTKQTITDKNVNISIPVQDVKINGTSILSGNVADIGIGTLSLSGESQATTSSSFSNSITLHNVAKSGKYADLLEKPNIVDNLDSSSTTDVLSANQGKQLKSMIQGISSGHTYADIEAMIETLNNANKSSFNVGASIYLLQQNVPDFWITEVLSGKQTFIYTTDDEFLNLYNDSATVQVGYYKIAKMNDSKVDLNDYVTSTEFEEAIAELTPILSDLDENKVDKSTTATVTSTTYTDTSKDTVKEKVVKEYINEIKPISFTSTSSTYNIVGNNSSLLLQSKTNDTADLTFSNVTLDTDADTVLQGAGINIGAVDGGIKASLAVADSSSCNMLLTESASTGLYHIKNIEYQIESNGLNITEDTIVLQRYVVGDGTEANADVGNYQYLMLTKDGLDLYAVDSNENEGSISIIDSAATIAFSDGNSTNELKVTADGIFYNDKEIATVDQSASKKYLHKIKLNLINSDGTTAPTKQAIVYLDYYSTQAEQYSNPVFELIDYSSPIGCTGFYTDTSVSLTDKNPIYSLSIMTSDTLKAFIINGNVEIDIQDTGSSITDEIIGYVLS